jgi:hypothetical protein
MNEQTVLANKSETGLLSNMSFKQRPCVNVVASLSTSVKVYLFRQLFQFLTKKAVIVLSPGIA